MSLHILPKLEYSYSALEPYFDAQTMELHHQQHHQTYLDKFKTTLAKYPDLQSMSADNILKNINSLKVDENDRRLLKNNGGGFVNHNLFWQILSPKKQINQQLVEQVINQFGSLESFKEQFSLLAASHFGSGWAWLVYDENKKLIIYSLTNQDSPLSINHTPIFNLDLWEHAYYLKYQNRRTDYIKAFWQVFKLF